MGVSPPSLYAAFGDKHRLFEEAAATYFERTCEGLDHAAEFPTARDAVWRMLEDTPAPIPTPRRLRAACC